MPVTVAVQVVDGAPFCIILIYQVIAVVVPAVASLLRLRAYIGVGVITIPRLLGAVWGRTLAQALGVRDNPVAIPVGILVKGHASLGPLFVGLSIAVVVLVVAALNPIGVDIRVIVCAIEGLLRGVLASRAAQATALTCPITVPIFVQIELHATIGIFLIYFPVAVIVLAIAHLRYPRVHIFIILRAIASLAHRMAGVRSAQALPLT